MLTAGPQAERIFRDDISLSSAATFRLMLQKDQRSPINTTRDATFFHIRADKLLLMCATKGNPNAMLIFEYLYAMAATFNEYFGELNPTTVHRNSSVIYELIDDMLDYGFPQITGADKLKAYIRGDGEKQARSAICACFVALIRFRRWCSGRR